MSADLCPYCGTLLTSSLRFCVNCRRSVTEDKLKAVGKLETDEEPQPLGAARYKLARKSDYDGVRQARTLFGTCSTLVFIVLVYYCMMKFVIHQPIPFEDQLTAMTQGFQQRADQPGSTMQQPPTDPTAH